MNGGLWHCTGDRNQDYPQEKEIQEGKMVEEALQISVKEEKEKAKEKSKDTPIWMQSSKE